MTYDDGILRICRTINVAAPGEKPVTQLKEKDKFYYGYDTLGFQRYYTAKQAQEKIECVVNIPGWNDIESTDICVLENEKQYRLSLIQPTLDKDGLKMTKLSLERISEKYDFKAESD